MKFRPEVLTWEDVGTGGLYIVWSMHARHAALEQRVFVCVCILEIANLTERSLN